MDITESISEFLSKNQFASGGLLLGAAGALAASLRSYPSRLWNWGKSKCFITVEVLGKDEIYSWFEKWLSAHEYSSKSMRLTAWSGSNRKNGPSIVRSSDGKQKPPDINFSPSPGLHVIRYKGVWMVITKERKETQENGYASFRESFEIKAFTRKREIVMSLLEEARDFALPAGGVQIFAPRYEDWVVMKRSAPRPLDSVFLEGDLKESVVADVKKFIASREWYQSVGIPYRRGYLFEGIPGSGKSSLALAIASELNLNICVLSLSNPNMSDDRLMSLMDDLPADSVLLLEDIDCAGPAARKMDSNPELPEHLRPENKGVTLSGLLNALDGVAAADGQIVIMTTNCQDKLDKAMIRPGRIDLRCEFGMATTKQIEAMFNRFYPGLGTTCLMQQFAGDIPDKSVSMASIQGLLIENRDDPVMAVKHAKERFSK